MSFRIGDTRVDIAGSSPVARRLSGLLEFLADSGGSADIEFEFVDRLPGWSGVEHCRFDGYRVGKERFAAADRLFEYDVDGSGGGIKVAVVQRRGGIVKEGALAVRKTWRHLHTHGRGAYLHRLKRFVFYVYMPLVELALLRKGATFAHCSAIEKDGQAVLFSALGGVGKTGIMSMYMQRGWRFLSDDFCVIDAGGRAHIHPLPMHVYRYHEVHSDGLVDRMLQASSSWDRLLWSACRPFKSPGKLVRWIEPEKVFGRDKLARQARIGTVIHMARRRNSGGFDLQSRSAEDVARLTAHTVFDEINNLAGLSVAVNSCEQLELLPGIAQLYQRVFDVYRDAFAAASCYSIIIPQDATVVQAYEFLRERQSEITPWAAAD